jgi:hypothetical protein
VLADIEFGQGIEDAWSSIASFVPKLVGFLIILIIGYLIAKAISKIAAKALDRVGFDKAVERGGIRKALEGTDYDASDIVGKVIFYALFLLVLQMAFGVFGTNPVSDLIEGVIGYLPKVIAAILIIVVASAIAAVLKEAIEAALGNLGYAKAVAAGVSIAVLVVGVFAALDQLEIAPDIVNGLFYAMLAVVAGSAIIAIGGGGIRPMQDRWQQVLSRYDEEKPRMQEQREGAADRIAARAAERTQQAKGASGGGGGNSSRPTGGAQRAR